ncbi:uncharacterized protein LOC122669664 [Telopea speciosissima]|uniref:uncharacterized protein LOC122669664 n=1 Tax=Telopea speciosissima TaxID=54955 RepID=UPI001CC4D700|nr:uncharacterized protein LOC122669664 [Telopea speciosissima]
MIQAENQVLCKAKDCPSLQEVKPTVEDKDEEIKTVCNDKDETMLEDFKEEIQHVENSVVEDDVAILKEDSKDKVAAEILDEVMVKEDFKNTPLEAVNIKDAIVTVEDFIEFMIPYYFYEKVPKVADFFHIFHVLPEFYFRLKTHATPAVFILRHYKTCGRVFSSRRELVQYVDTSSNARRRRMACGFMNFLILSLSRNLFIMCSSSGWIRNL